MIGNLKEVLTSLRPALVCALALFALGCGGRGKDALTLAGSTSVEPYAERLAELYMPAHPGSKISVQGGGSSAGIRAVQNRICEIGMSSRELNADEQGLTRTPIAIDAIALIVNAGNPVRSLTLVQARDIFAGRILNWRDVGGPDRAITAITREEGSGTRSAFEEKVMAAGMPKDDKGKAEPLPFAARCLVQNSNGSVREIVATDPYAIGYISVGLVDKRIHALALDGIAPTERNIRSKAYPLAREFLFLTRGAPTGKTADFINFVLGPDGQRSLAEEGLIPIH